MRPYFSAHSLDLGAVFRDATKHYGSSDLVIFYDSRRENLCVAVPRADVLADPDTPPEVREAISVPAPDFEGPLKGCSSAFWVVRGFSGGVEVGVGAPKQGSA